MVNLKKIKQVENYQNLLLDAEGFFVIGFKKIAHQKFEQLRKELNKNQFLIKVIKNTIFEKAVNKLINKNKFYKELKKNFFPLKENSALIIIKKSDFTHPLKAFYNFLSNKDFYFKFGLLENNIYSGEKLEKIAQLPPKTEILTKVIVLIKNPIFKFNFALNYNIIKLINIFKNKSKL